MTLKEKFYKEFISKPDLYPLEESEKIAEDFAIRFCIWLADEQTNLDTTYKKEHFEELLEIYKKEQKL